MKYTKILFWLVVCLFFVGVTVHSTSAVTLNNSEAYYSLDNSTITGTNVSDISGNLHWGTNFNTIWDTGILAECRYYDGLADVIKIHDDLFNGNGDFTFNFWINYTSAGALYIFDKGDGGAASSRTAIFLNLDETNAVDKGNIVLFTRDASTVGRLSPTANPNLDDGSWHMVTMVYDDAANTGAIYIDGSSVGVSGSVAGGDVHEDGKKHWIGEANAGTNSMNGDIDEFAFYKRKLNSTEVSALWNGGTGYNPYAPSPGPGVELNLSEITPAPPKAQFNTNPVNVWALGNASANWTCRLYINGVVNQTRQLSNGTNVNCSFNINFTNGEWNISIRGNTTLTDKNTSIVTIYFDNVNPIITLNTFNTGLLYYNSNLSWNFTITDNFYLHRINVTINNGVGQIFGLMDVNTTSYPLNLTYNTTGLNVGDYILSVTACDGHTTQSIQDYGITTLTSGLQYTTKSISLQLKSKDSLDYFSTTKLKDRYTFEYEPFKTLNSYTLDVISSEKIHFAEKDGFKWLISGNNWIDFAPYHVRYNRINDKHVQAIIENPSLDTKLKFNSIGDLNCITKNYSFAITNLTVIYNNPVVETGVETFRLRIDNQNSLVTNTTAQLYWNGTLIATTKSVIATFDRFTGVVTMPTLTVDQTFQFNWVYNITTLNGSLSGNLSFNQTVLNINVNNTWGCTPIVLYFDYQDEITNASLLVNTESLLTLEFNNNEYVFNFSQNNVSNTTFCINPALASMGVNATVWHVWEDDSQDYYSREYRNRVLLQNTTSQVNLTNITLLLLSKTYNQTVRHNIYVADSNDLPQRGFYVHMYKFSIAKNNYTFIESFRSNIDGLGVISGVDERYYRFQVFNPGWDLVYESETFKLITIDVYLRITETMTILQNWMRLKNSLNYTLYWNNNTHVATFTWNDPTNLANQLCLRVTQMMVGNTTVLYDACSNALTGTLTYNVSALQNRTFVAYAYESGSLYLLDTKSLSYFLNPMDWGTDGLLIGVLWLGTIGMIAIGVTPVTALALMEVGFLSLFVLGFVHIGYTSFISMALGVVIIILLKVRN